MRKNTNKNCTLRHKNPAERRHSYIIIYLFCEYVEFIYLINIIGLLRTVAFHTLVLGEKWLEIQHKGGGQRKRPQQKMENKKP
jgi:UPF0716 family protein affecting phage T7 exclusion